MLRAMRSPRPVFAKPFVKKKARRTSQRTSSEKAATPSANVSVPVMSPTARAQNATPGAGRGPVTMPQMVAAKSARVDQPCMDTPAGTGITKRMSRPSPTEIARGPSLAPFVGFGAAAASAPARLGPRRRPAASRSTATGAARAHRGRGAPAPGTRHPAAPANGCTAWPRTTGAAKHRGAWPARSPWPAWSAAPADASNAELGARRQRLLPHASCLVAARRIVLRPPAPATLPTALP
mmetsp:Transcript_92812/g.262502  ORF Transcript_92812/g.262502 Transcript_92812/m.262502 type:complete len:237 (+) Transcript_92812:1162-1872(+)